MGKLESGSAKEATWRNHLERHAASGMSIAAFCRAEAISAARSLGTDIRIDLGDGIVLTIARR